MATKPPAPSDLADKFMLRMPEGMRDRIAAAAKASGRSMNAEIVQRLEFALGFNDRMDSGPEELGAMLAAKLSEQEEFMRETREEVAEIREWLRQEAKTPPPRKKI